MENKLNCITSTGQHQFDKESNRIECKICGLLKSTIEANSTKDVEFETEPLVIKNGFAEGGNVKVKDIKLERVLKEFDKSDLYLRKLTTGGKAIIKNFITQAYNLGKGEERKRLINKIKKIKLWSKGTTEGTRADILNSIGENKGEV